MNKYKNILYLLLFVTISETFDYILLSGEIVISNQTLIFTFISYIEFFILLSIAIKSKIKTDIPFSIHFFYKFWLYLLFFNSIRGLFIAKGYWEWKMYVGGWFLFLAVSLAFYLATNLDYIKYIFKYVIKYMFAFGFLLIPIGLATNPEVYSRVMIPISLFLLFIPYVKPKWKILMIIVMFVSIILVLGFRSNIIKCSFSLFLLLLYYFRKYISINFLRWCNIILFILPIILLYSAIYNDFNIFQDLSNQKRITANEVKDQNGEVSLNEDTRTLLYIEVFNSMDTKSDWIIGKSVIGSYKTEIFEGMGEGGAIDGKRYGIEVGFLSLLLKNGIIGVLIYFILLFTVSWIAISNSSNFLSKILGLYIAFRWTYFFVEEYATFDINFFFFWITIGLVSRNQFRDMNDDEITTFFELKDEEEINCSAPYLS